MNDSVNLLACNRCGGALGLVEGVDIEQAERTQVYEEVYECALCGETGTLTVERRGQQTKTTATGVVSA